MRAASQSAKLAGGLFVTGFCLWLVVRHIDWAEAWETVMTANGSWLLFALALLVVGYTSRVVRWWLMLRSMSPNVSFSACLGPFLSSMAVNNVLPFRAGDVLRVVGFRAHLDIGPIQLTSTLVLERLLDLSALLGFFFAGLAYVHNGLFPHAVVITTGWMAAGCLLLVVITVVIPHQLERLAANVAVNQRLWPLARRVAGGLRQFFSSLAAMRAPRLVGRLLTLSFMIWFLEGGVFLSVARALDLGGIGAGPWFALSTGTLGTLLPSTPGYVGTFDYFTMLGLTAYRVPQPQAAVFALIVHLVLWLPVTAIGLGWLAVHKLSPSPSPVDVSPSMTRTT